MSETMANKEVTEQILVSLGDKLERDFGKRPDGDVVLQLAKSFGFVKGRQGRGGGTFPEQAGYAFLTSVSVIEDEPEVCETEACGCDNALIEASTAASNTFNDSEDPGVLENLADDSIPF